MASLTLEPAAADHEYAERLLRRNDLPSADIGETQVTVYRGTVEGEPIGIGGIEERGERGLLRSVVVEKSHRGRGYGGKLCAALETHARESGINGLYLLTATAAEFFDAQGYVTVERASVPEAIRETAQFEELCPASATCMCKSL